MCYNVARLPRAPLLQCQYKRGRSNTKLVFGLKARRLDCGVERLPGGHWWGPQLASYSTDSQNQQPPVLCTLSMPYPILQCTVYVYVYGTHSLTNGGKEEIERSRGQGPGAPNKKLVQQSFSVDREKFFFSASASFDRSTYLPNWGKAIRSGNVTDWL